MIIGRWMRSFRRQSSWLPVYFIVSMLVMLQILHGYTKNSNGGQKLDITFVKRTLVTQPASAATTTQLRLISARSNKVKEMSQPLVIVDQIIKSGTTYFQLEVRHEEALLYGHYRNYTGYMTIGVPTVQREGISYLEETLNSLIDHTSKEQKENIVIVVYFGDKNHTWVTGRAREIYLKYKHFVDEGFIQLVHPQHNLYPNFDILKRNFNDSRERVTWRSKQNIDYAYLFLYSQNFSSYYLQLEDDVTAARNYFQEIKKFVESKNTHQSSWFCLQFSNLGFIGKLFRSSDLQKIADFLLMFYSEQPGDLLLNYLKRVMTQFKDIVKRPALFQHRGVVSSLAGKRQFNVEKSFRDGATVSRKKYYNKNPSAEIETTMELYEDNHPEYAYDLSDRYFWAVAPSAGAYYRIIFHSPQTIDGIFVDTGYKSKPRDIIKRGTLKVSIKDEPEKKPCTDLKSLGSLMNGDIDTRKLNITKRHIHDVDCVSIEVTNSQKEWVVIREIAIFGIQSTGMKQI